jgi:hypothetical protein
MATPFVPIRLTRPGRCATASQDLYQWYLMISTHSMRHILQIREVKAHEDFPRQ